VLLCKDTHGKHVIQLGRNVQGRMALFPSFLLIQGASPKGGKGRDDKLSDNLETATSQINNEVTGVMLDQQRCLTRFDGTFEAISSMSAIFYSLPAFCFMQPRSHVPIS